MTQYASAKVIVAHPAKMWLHKFNVTPQYRKTAPEQRIAVLKHAATGSPQKLMAQENW